MLCSVPRALESSVTESLKLCRNFTIHVSSRYRDLLEVLFLPIRLGQLRSSSIFLVSRYYEYNILTDPPSLPRTNFNTMYKGFICWNTGKTLIDQKVLLKRVFLFQLWLCATIDYKVMNPRWFSMWQNPDFTEETLNCFKMEP